MCCFNKFPKMKIWKFGERLERKLTCFWYPQSTNARDSASTCSPPPSSSCSAPPASRTDYNPAPSSPCARASRARASCPLAQDPSWCPAWRFEAAPRPSAAFSRATCKIVGSSPSAGRSTADSSRSSCPRFDGDRERVANRCDPTDYQSGRTSACCWPRTGSAWDLNESWRPMIVGRKSAAFHSESCGGRGGWWRSLGSCLSFDTARNWGVKCKAAVGPSRGKVPTSLSPTACCLKTMTTSMIADASAQGSRVSSEIHLFNSRDD